MTRAHPLFLEVASRLRRLARDGETEWSFSIHAEEEMIEDGLEYSDVVYVAQHCKIISGTFEGNSWDCLVEGKTTDSILVALPVCFSFDETYIEIISAWIVE